MPALSPTMSQGNLAKWHVQVGDLVRPGSVLAEIETDKATLAFENQDDGYVAKLLVHDGTKDIPIGQPVCVLVEEEASIPALKDWAPGKGAGAAAPAKEAAPPARPAAAPQPSQATAQPAGPVSCAWRRQV
jgi:pyruvate dehydrogenase E2 component (dihydrolipoamide acetyltransferase)